MSQHREVYIGTGEKAGFYTLHLVHYDAAALDGFRDNYIKNLSTDWDKASEKAITYANRLGAYFHEDPFELDEIGKLRAGERWNMILKFKDPAEVPFGKYAGKGLLETIEKDADYIWWMVNAICQNGKDEQIPFKIAAINALDTLGIEDPAIAREREYEERKAHDAEIAATADPVPTDGKRHTFTGEILTTKWQDSYYGSTLKMLFRDDRGFKLWGSVPSGLDEDLGGHDQNNGDKHRIQFDAAVQQSGDDEKFGYFKRPTKAEILS